MSYVLSFLSLAEPSLAFCRRSQTLHRSKLKQTMQARDARQAAYLPGWAGKGNGRGGSAEGWSRATARRFRGCFIMLLVYTGQGAIAGVYLSAPLPQYAHRSSVQRMPLHRLVTMSVRQALAKK